jgi:hypothetical protein
MQSFLKAANPRFCSELSFTGEIYSWKAMSEESRKENI